MSIPHTDYDVETELLCVGSGRPIAVLCRVVKTTSVTEGETTTVTRHIVDGFKHTIKESP